MPLSDIERLCRAIVPGTGAVEVKALANGLISETYRVVRDGVAYALKTACPQRADFGLDLAWEAQVLERAGSLGLAPPLVYCDLERAVLSRWVAGRTWSPLEVRRAANITKIAQLLRRVHALLAPPPPRVMSPMSWIRVYGAALTRRARGAFDGALRAAAESRLQRFAELPAAAGVVCHSDLHAMNVMQADEILTLLDWEYAHVSDPLWDLAGWAANNDLEPETQRELLMNYLGIAPTAAEWQRLRLLTWLYDYVCLLWSELYLNARRDGVNGIRERATLLDARLRLPAHYAP
ncbi:MAG TPA: phosphotransferase [Steroidobacteraceae bacterium]|nr:phosphotransferase [Steroidobacteraceae bacterium]